MKIKNKRMLAGGILLVASAIGFLTSTAFLCLNLFGGTKSPSVATDGVNRVILINDSELVIGDINEFIKYNSPNTSVGERKVYVNTQYKEVAKADIKKILITENVSATYVPNFLSGGFYNAANLTEVNMSGLTITVPETPVITANNFFYNTFAGCGNLIRVEGLPSLPNAAAELKTVNNYFYNTFKDCVSLTDVSSLPALPKNLTSLNAVDYYYTGTLSGCVKLVNLPAIPALPESSSGSIVRLNYYLGGVYDSCKAAVILPPLPKIPETAVKLQYVNGYLKQSYQNMNTSRPEIAANALPALPAGAVLLEEINFYLANLFYLTYPKNNVFPTLPALPAEAVNIKKADNYLSAAFGMGLNNNLTYPALPALPAGATGLVSANNYLKETFSQCYGSKQFPTLPVLPNTAELLYANSYLEKTFFNSKYVTGAELPALPITAVKLHQMNNYLAGTFRGSDISAISALPQIPVGAVSLTQANNYLLVTFEGCNELVSLPALLPALPSGSTNSIQLESYCKQTFENSKLLTGITIPDIPGLPASIVSFPQDCTFNYAGGTNLVSPDTPMTALSYNDKFDNWTMPPKHNLILNSNGAVFQNVPMYEGGSISKSALPAPQRQYWTFDGWYTTQAFTKEVDTVTMKTGDINVYAKWTEYDKYNLRLNSNGAVIKIISLHKTESIAVADFPVPTNGDEYYSFGGWYNDTARTSRCGDEIIMANSDINVYAKWNEFTKHDLILNSNDSVTEIISLHETEEYAESELPPPTNGAAFYSFDGWYNDAELTDKTPAVITMGTKDINIYAKWKEFNTHSLIFNTNGGSSIAPITLHETEELNLTDIPVPARLYWEFVGWYNDAELTEKTSAVIIMGTENINLYAKWQEGMQYNLICNHPDGTETKIPLHIGESIFLGSIAIPAGSENYHSFDGWYTDAEFTVQAPPTITMGTKDINIYAKWKEFNTHSLIFNTNGGSSIASITLHETAITAKTELPEPRKENYTFADWYTDSEFINPAPDEIVMDTADMTLYAKWLLAAVILRFNTLGGSQIEDVKISVNETLQLPTPTKNGFVFVQWYTDIELTNDFNIAGIAGDNITLYAFYMDAGEIAQIIPGDAGEPVTYSPPIEDELKWSGSTTTVVTAAIGAIGSVSFAVAGTMLTLFNKKKSVFGKQ
jgi:uncharacterized repeat protein (TIGR02543 family)